MSSKTNPATSIHACAIILGTKGVLVRGESGSGKSQTCLSLIDRWHGQNDCAYWIADDRKDLETRANRVVARAPAQIAGRIECRHVGIQTVTSLKEGVIDLVVDLVDFEKLDRLPEVRTTHPLSGSVSLPLFLAPERQADHASALIQQFLTQPD